MKFYLFMFLLFEQSYCSHYFSFIKRPPPPSPSPPPPFKLETPISPPPFPSPLPPGVPLNACKVFIPNLCDNLHESNYFDVNCYSNEDPYGGLGCNAGGLICCRFCEFSQYKSVPCILSPSQPPFFPPPPPPPFAPPSSPPLNPLIISIGDPIIEPDKSKINFHMRIDSDIESINKINVQKKIFNIFDRYISKQFIRVNFRPGSLIVDVSIVTNITLTENTTNIIDHISKDEMSNVLNLTVVELSPPIIEVYQEEINNSDMGKYYIIGIVLMLFCFCIAYICYKYDYSCNNKKDLDLNRDNYSNNNKNKNKNKNKEVYNINRLSGVSKYNETILFENTKDITKTNEFMDIDC